MGSGPGVGRAWLAGGGSVWGAVNRIVLGEDDSFEGRGGRIITLSSWLFIGSCSHTPHTHPYLFNNLGTPVTAYKHSAY